MTIIMPEAISDSLEGLDWSFDQSCESDEAWHNKFGEGPATVYVSVVFSCCPRSADIYLCDGCLNEIMTTEDVYRCTACGDPAPHPFRKVIQNTVYL